MSEPQSVLHYETADGSAANRLTADELGAVKLGAMLWVAAAAIYFGASMIQLMLQPPSLSHTRVLVLREAIHQPNIVAAAQWISAWSLPVRAALFGLGALLWAVAAGLLSDVAKPPLQRTRWAIHIALTLTVMGAICANFLP